MKRTSRKPSNLADSLQRHLNAYAMAASAAGVGMLALAQPAEAKIVYTKIHHVIGTRGHYDLDLNHDRVTDFLIRQVGTNSGGVCYSGSLCSGQIRVSERAGNFVEGNSTYYGPLASALKRGAKIGPGASFIKGWELMARTWAADGNSGRSGKWINVTNRYLGLKFKVDGQTHYGWARMTVKLPGKYLVDTTLTGYAYETVPNKPIIAGKTKGPDVITVEPASLGALAAGRR